MVNRSDNLSANNALQKDCSDLFDLLFDLFDLLFDLFDLLFDLFDLLFDLFESWSYLNGS